MVDIMVFFLASGIKFILYEVKQINIFSVITTFLFF